MRKEGNELLQFLGGLAMLIVGLYIFAQKVTVSSSFFGGGMMFGSMRIHNGLIIVPFIIGIVWMFASGASFGSKVFTGLGVLLIIVSIIMSTNIYLSQISLYEWILILVLIFGGAGLLAKILLAGPKRNAVLDVRERDRLESEQKAKEIEEEIERMKKGK